MERPIDCISCLFKEVFSYMKLVGLDISGSKVLLKYIVEGIGEKKFSEIYYGFLKLAYFLDNSNRLLSIRRRLLDKTKKLYDMALTITDSLRKMGFEDILSRILMLSILVDNPWYFVDKDLAEEISYGKFSAILSNPAPPGLEVLKVVDYLPTSSTIAYYLGSLASLWIDKLFIETMLSKGINAQVYTYTSPMGFQPSLDDLKKVLKSLDTKFYVISKPREISLGLFEAIKRSDLVVIRDPMVVEVVLENIDKLRNIALANKVILVFRRECQLVQKVLGYPFRRYIVVSADVISGKLFLE